MQFENDYFLFDGIDSRTKDIYLISTDSGESEHMFGLKRAINIEQGVGDIPTFIGVNESTFDIKLQITKCNEVGQAVSFTSDDKYEIARWLIKKEPKALCIDEMIYYVVAKEGNRWFGSNDTGYITLTFESVSPFCYAPIKTEYFLVDGSYSLSLDNHSMVESIEYVDIDLKKVSGSWIEFTNNDLSETFKIENLDQEDINIKIYGEGMFYLENKDLKNKNMRPKITKEDWVRLIYGRNNIDIKTDGEFYCRITYQEKNPLI